MFCTHCGAANPDNATKCAACGQALYVIGPNQAVSPPPLGAPQVRIPTYLVQSILATVFCCMPFGVVAIVYAAQAGARVSAGDYAGAKRASDSAKMWCWIAFGLGCCIVLFYVVLGVVSALSHRPQQ
ncbi:MAG TPA: CD225/dispanin family protein [Pirellulales bacterium]